MKNSKINWITYLSATSVYGDHKGEWVNEDSETNPTSINGIARLKAENDWVSLEKNNKLPIQIFRLSGIYSDEKNILSQLTPYSDILFLYCLDALIFIQYQFNIFF